MSRFSFAITLSLSITTIVCGCASHRPAAPAPNQCETTDQPAARDIHISQAEVDALTAPFRLGMTYEDVMSLDYEYEATLHLVEPAQLAEACHTKLADGTKLIIAFMDGRVICMEMWDSPRTAGDIAIGMSFATLKQNHPDAPCYVAPGSSRYVEVTEALRALFSYMPEAPGYLCPPEDDERVRALEIRPDYRKATQE